MSDDAYSRLEAQFTEIGRLDDIRRLLDWDRATMMPDGGSDARGAQLETLAALRHRLVTQPDVARWLDDTDPSALTAWEEANLSAMRRMHLHAASVPSALIEALARAANRAEHLWRRARKDDDFASVEPALGELLALVREEAAIKSDALGVSPYEALMDRYDPGRRWAEVETLFSALHSRLAPMVDRTSQIDRTPASLPGSVQKQRMICEDVLKTVGFDWNHGRLDESAHPFTGGVPDDVRITTRYAEEDVLAAVFATIHEAGHAQYERGLPAPWRGQPVGRAPGLTIHESQSLGFEMQIARSRSFTQFLAPLIARHLGRPATEIDALLGERLVHVERTFIRVEADEMTYPLHILARSELEQALVSGQLQTRDLPEAWGEAYLHHVGIRPKNDRDGCLQDIHWYGGDFGYFPTYALGALAAAQLVAAAREKLPNLDDSLSAGDWSGYLDWCRQHVHSHGSRFSADELILRATGKPLGIDAYLAHLEARFLP